MGIKSVAESNLQSLLERQSIALDENNFTEADRLEALIQRLKRKSEFTYCCQDCGECYTAQSEQTGIFLCPPCTDVCVGY